MWVLLRAWLALGLLLPRPVVAQTPPDARVSLARLTFYVTGLNLRRSPDRQAVPKDITIIVNTELLFGTDAVNFADVRAATWDDIQRLRSAGPSFYSGEGRFIFNLPAA